MIKRLLQSLCLLLVVLGFNACSSDDNSNMTGDEQTFVTFWINDPQGAKIEEIKQMTIKLTELNSNKKTELVYEGDKKIQKALPTGTYDITVEGVITHKVNGVVEESKVGNFIKGVVISGREMTKAIDIVFKTSSTGFVIEEVFFAGTKTPQGLQYTDDQYFKITNNSDEVLYADGLTIAESTFMTTNKYDYTPNLMDKKVAVQAVYKVPGSGKEYPIQPGKSIIIADKAIDHVAETGIPTSFDLSKADFEWYDESSVPTMQDTDNPNVPNLDKIYSYTRSIWIISQQGNRAYLLLRMGTDTEDFLNNYEESYKYIHPATNKEMTSKSYFVPNEWILDAVNLSPKDKYAWLVTDSSLDAGYTQCGENSKDPNRYGKSIRRKVSHVNEKGRSVLQDTNNSSEDFIPTSIPSLLK